MLSTTEGIIVSAIVGFVPADVDRRRHYITSYMDGGMEIKHYVRSSTDSVNEYVSHATRNKILAAMYSRLLTLNRNTGIDHNTNAAIITLRCESKRRILYIKFSIWEGRYEVYLTQLFKEYRNSQYSCRMSCCKDKDGHYEPCMCGKKSMKIFYIPLLYLELNSRFNVIDMINRDYGNDEDVHLSN
jgi:hypothetical protein